MKTLRPHSKTRAGARIILWSVADKVDLWGRPRKNPSRPLRPTKGSGNRKAVVLLFKEARKSKQLTARQEKLALAALLAAASPTNIPEFRKWHKLAMGLRLSELRNRVHYLDSVEPDSREMYRAAIRAAEFVSKAYWDVKS